MDPAVDAYLDEAETWQDEMRLLRTIALASGLMEAYKWRQPCYTAPDSSGKLKNVAIIGPTKDYCAFAFFKGALLTDPDGRLVTPGKNSQSDRMLTFTTVDDIEAARPVIEAFIREAVALEAADAKVELKATADYDVPDELLAAFAASPDLEAAFAALTPGRQRGFLLHFAGAKQSATRAARIENHRERIFAGKGIQDCVCGRSQRMPRCDGSHNR